MSQTTDSPEFKEALRKIEGVLEGRPSDEQREILEGAIRLEAVNHWLGSDPPLMLERNDHSRLHRLKEAIAGKRLLWLSGMDVPEGAFYQTFEHTFVVKHDWARAFEGADGIENSVRLPYEHCVFEFRLGGKTIIVLAVDDPNLQFRFGTVVEWGDFWVAIRGPADPRQSRITEFLRSQISAICIALDAEVATHTVERAPFKLNEKREKAGKPRIADFHVVDLARRHRVANPTAERTGRRVKLHFRRGHWRHYEANKTWIKWCLVGDPDLGFIQKQYTL